MNTEKKTAIFIDGSNVYATCKLLRRDIDWSLLIKAFGGNVTSALYFTAVNEQAGETPLIPLIDWLSYNNYIVVRKPTKTFVDDNGREKIKGNMDIEIAVHAMKLRDHIDNAVIFSGDGDFTSLVLALQDAAVHVTVVSSIKTKPSMIADELRRACNSFIEIGELPIFTGNGSTREKSRYG